LDKAPSVKTLSFYVTRYAKRLYFKLRWWQRLLLTEMYGNSVTVEVELPLELLPAVGTGPFGQLGVHHSHVEI
jgi:hypothetical protein